jgi:hypothetical protein
MNVFDNQVETNTILKETQMKWYVKFISYSIDNYFELGGEHSMI